MANTLYLNFGRPTKVLRLPEVSHDNACHVYFVVDQLNALENCDEELRQALLAILRTIAPETLCISSLVRDKWTRFDLGALDSTSHSLGRLTIALSAFHFV